MDINRKKILYIIVGVIFILASIGLGIWLSRRPSPPPVEIPKELSEVELQIDATKKRLEELAKLTPEELAKREKEREILTAQKVAEDVTVEGVTVTTSDDQKLIRNIFQGYTLKVPQNLVIARSVSSDDMELHDKKTMCLNPSCDPVIRITVRELNPQKFPLEEWFKKAEEDAGNPIYSPREKIILDGSEVWRVTEELPPQFSVFYYYWSRGDKIYALSISRFDEPTYRSAIQSFRLE